MSDTGVLQKVVGLKTKHDLSDAQFVNFFNRVQEEANKQGKVFFLDCGEGNMAEFDDMLAMDLSGWLVDFSEAKEFESFWLIGSDYVPEKFVKDECEEEWSKDKDGLHINLITF